MAIKKMYRSLMLDQGAIKLMDFNFYANQIVLDVVEVHYDDRLGEDQREMLIKAIEDNIAEKKRKHEAEMHMLSKMREELLLLSAPTEGEYIPKGE